MALASTRTSSMDFVMDGQHPYLSPIEDIDDQESVSSDAISLDEDALLLHTTASGAAVLENTHQHNPDGSFENDLLIFRRPHGISVDLSQSGMSLIGGRQRAWSMEFNLLPTEMGELDHPMDLGDLSAMAGLDMDGMFGQRGRGFSIDSTCFEPKIITGMLPPPALHTDLTSASSNASVSSDSSEADDDSRHRADSDTRTCVGPTTVTVVGAGDPPSPVLAAEHIAEHTARHRTVAGKVRRVPLSVAQRLAQRREENNMTEENNSDTDTDMSSGGGSSSKKSSSPSYDRKVQVFKMAVKKSKGCSAIVGNNSTIQEDEYDGMPPRYTENSMFASGVKGAVMGLTPVYLRFTGADTIKTHRPPTHQSLSYRVRQAELNRSQKARAANIASSNHNGNGRHSTSSRVMSGHKTAAAVAKAAVSQAARFSPAGSSKSKMGSMFGTSPTLAKGKTNAAAAAAARSASSTLSKSGGRLNLSDALNTASSATKNSFLKGGIGGATTASSGSNARVMKSDSLAVIKHEHGSAMSNSNRVGAKIGIKPTFQRGASTNNVKREEGMTSSLNKTMPSAASASTLPIDRSKYIGTLTLEQRRARIDRFLEKRKRRVWKKKVKYSCRKKLADSRPRVKGRFVPRAVQEAVMAEQEEKGEMSQNTTVPIAANSSGIVVKAESASNKMNKTNPNNIYAQRVNNNKGSSINYATSSAYKPGYTTNSQQYTTKTPMYASNKRPLSYSSASSSGASNRSTTPIKTGAARGTYQTSVNSNGSYRTNTSTTNNNKGARVLYSNTNSTNSTGMYKPGSGVSGVQRAGTSSNITSSASPGTQQRTFQPQAQSRVGGVVGTSAQYRSTTTTSNGSTSAAASAAAISNRIQQNRVNTGYINNSNGARVVQQQTNIRNGPVRSGGSGGLPNRPTNLPLRTGVTGGGAVSNGSNIPYRPITANSSNKTGTTYQTRPGVNNSSYQPRTVGTTVGTKGVVFQSSRSIVSNNNVVASSKTGALRPAGSNSTKITGTYQARPVLSGGVRSGVRAVGTSYQSKPISNINSNVIKTNSNNINNNATRSINNGSIASTTTNNNNMVRNNSINNSNKSTYQSSTAPNRILSTNGKVMSSSSGPRQPGMLSNNNKNNNVVNRTGGNVTRVPNTTYIPTTGRPVGTTTAGGSGTTFNSPVRAPLNSATGTVKSGALYQSNNNSINNNKVNSNKVNNNNGNTGTGTVGSTFKTSSSTYTSRPSNRSLHVNAQRLSTSAATSASNLSATATNNNNNNNNNNNDSNTTRTNPQQQRVVGNTPLSSAGPRPMYTSSAGNTSSTTTPNRTVQRNGSLGQRSSSLPIQHTNIANTPIVQQRSGLSTNMANSPMVHQRSGSTTNMANSLVQRSGTSISPSRTGTSILSSTNRTSTPVQQRSGTTSSSTNRTSTPVQQRSNMSSTNIPNTPMVQRSNSIPAGTTPPRNLNSMLNGRTNTPIRTNSIVTNDSITRPQYSDSPATSGNISGRVGGNANNMTNTSANGSTSGMLSSARTSNTNGNGVNVTNNSPGRLMMTTSTGAPTRTPVVSRGPPMALSSVRSLHSTSSTNANNNNSNNNNNNNNTNSNNTNTNNTNTSIINNNSNNSNNNSSNSSNNNNRSVSPSAPRSSLSSTGATSTATTTPRSVIMSANSVRTKPNTNTTSPLPLKPTTGSISQVSNISNTSNLTKSVAPPRPPMANRPTGSAMPQSQASPIRSGNSNISNIRNVSSKSAVVNVGPSTGAAVAGGTVGVSTPSSANNKDNVTAPGISPNVSRSS